MSDYATSAHAPRHPFTAQSNGPVKPVRATAWEPQSQDEQHYLAPDRGNDLHKKASGDLSANSSEQDGVQEYYKPHANKKRGPAPVKGKPKKKPSKSGVADPNAAAIELDENNWIHRDKLKEIETREMQEAGFRVGRASRSTSRSQSRTRRSRDRRGSEAELVQNGDEHVETRRVVSPIPAEEEEVEEQYNTWNAPALQEFAPDNDPASPRSNNFGVRPVTSRIPLPRTSGIPVPAAVAERDAPLPRSRASSNNWSGDAIAVNGARVRSGSVGSQVLLDSPIGERQVTPPYGHTRNFSAASASPKSLQKSPVKPKAPVKPAPAPTAGARKTSAAQKTQPKGRQVSGTSPPKRPGTSGGSVPRPTTGHRPEGDPPWLATMYKPDPRLPPDQQIIPTHAKRMQQEQWNSEGRVGSMYGTDFELLNTDEFKDKRLSQIQPIDIEKAQKDETWPLPSPTKQPSLEKVETNTNRSPVADQGAYKLTPTIPQSSRAPSLKLAPPIASASEPQPHITRLPEPAEEAKEKKACCCIVM
jgi:hypothetical protein